MTVLIAIPIFRVGCKVEIDRGRSWSVVEEALLWAVARQGRTIAWLKEQADLPHQIVVGALARLMQFRLVEALVSENGASFKASAYGLRIVTGGDALPYFPKRFSKRVGFVIEWATGEFFPTSQITLMSPYKLDQERRGGAEIRQLNVSGGLPPMSHSANLNRLADIATRGWDERIALVDGRTATLHDNEFMIVKVIDGAPRGLPDTTGPKLKALVDEACALPTGTKTMSVSYAGPREEDEALADEHPCSFDHSDIIIGGSQQRECFEGILQRAHRRVVIHSTFLDAKRFEVMSEPIRAACVRGVRFDFLWGAERDDDTEQKSYRAALTIAKMIRNDRDLRGRCTIHLRSTGSHAKLILADTLHDGWIGGVSSCNWLSSPFQSVELTALLRDQHAVADVAEALRHLVGRRGLYDDLATEMAITAIDLRRMPSGKGNDRVRLLIGEEHDRFMRVASGAAKRRFVVGSNRLGTTARPGALIQGEVAASAHVPATVLYSTTTGPVKNRHARALAEQSAEAGVRLVRTKKIPLHGKFVAVDDDEIAVTSLNWASASADPDFPWGEIGVQIRSEGIAAAVCNQLEGIFPMLKEGASASTEAVSD
ncbi:phosphatidylserine synthase [Agrobacterium vitis]|uniref:phosphatidylserine synthase n=1 Tax=Allorhizobium ampelinum TaxID=3025782 RepID=UPI001F411997|nr:phosphatidylserine synthase [Allorhizobium ampelinum]MCF1449905.1 phosphatidylserine synthase [Allorhizobium ampelinum]